MNNLRKNIIKISKNLLLFISLMFIKFYQACISPLFPGCCRFSPTCSQYAKESIEKFGTFIGLILTIKRLSKCHPFGKKGYDPVPDKVYLFNKSFIAK